MDAKAMKHLLTGFSLISAFALIAVAVGCASYEVRIKESLLSEAAFQTWTPTTQKQWAMYNRVVPTSSSGTRSMARRFTATPIGERGLSISAAIKRINATSDL
jgi:hypothetical protein